MAGSITNQDQELADFITINEFQATSSSVTKWADLPLEEIYLVKELKEKLVNREGKEINSMYAVLENQSGDVKNVWLTSVIEKELKKENIGGNGKIYVRSFGLKMNKSGTRKYFDFDIVKQS